MSREFDELVDRAVEAAGEGFGPLPVLGLDSRARQWLVMDAARRVIAEHAEGSPACAITAQQVTAALLEPGTAKRRAYELGGSIDSMRPYSSGLPSEIEELLLLLVLYLRDPARQDVAARKTAFRLAHDLDDDAPLGAALWATAWPSLAPQLVAQLGPLPMGKYAPTHDTYSAYADIVRRAADAGISQNETAQRLGISPKTAVKMLKG